MPPGPKIPLPCPGGLGHSSAFQHRTFHFSARPSSQIFLCSLGRLRRLSCENQWLQRLLITLCLQADILVGSACHKAPGWALLACLHEQPFMSLCRAQMLSKMFILFHCQGRRAKIGCRLANLVTLSRMKVSTHGCLEDFGHLPCA